MARKSRRHIYSQGIEGEARWDRNDGAQQTHQGERETRVSEDTTTKRSDDDEGDGRSDGNIPTGPSVDLRARDERLLQNDEGEERKPG